MVQIIYFFNGKFPWRYKQFLNLLLMCRIFLKLLLMQEYFNEISFKIPAQCKKSVFYRRSVFNEVNDVVQFFLNK